MMNENRMVPKTKLHFYHMRKCGGTSLRKTLKTYCIANDLEFHIMESNRFGGQPAIFGYKNPDVLIEDLIQGCPGSLLQQFYLMTNLRNPVDRVFSLYLQIAKNRTENAEPFETFFMDNILRRKRKPQYWNITSDYFIKTLLGIGGTVDEKDFKKCIRLLSNFDCIFILDQKSIITNGKFAHLRIPVKRRRKPEFYTNIQSDMEKMRPLVESYNQWDLKLYEYFVKRAFPIKNI